MPKVSSLGHIGIYVNDYTRMRDFYMRVLGLTVAHESVEHSMCFLSGQPEEEDHEILLVAGREGNAKLINQISFRVDSLETLRGFHRVFVDESVDISAVVTHGNAASVYFNDPEGNRLEVYYRIPVDWPQPFREPFNIDQDDQGILKQIDDMTFGSVAK
jgi:catechol-2,3-dioxygenase